MFVFVRSARRKVHAESKSHGLRAAPLGDARPSLDTEVLRAGRADDLGVYVTERRLCDLDDAAVPHEHVTDRGRISCTIEDLAPVRMYVCMR